MSIHTHPVSRSTSALRLRVGTAPLALFALVAVGALARAFAGHAKATPRLLPDEYLYTQLARSLAHGDGASILGQGASLPQLLQPLLMAPFWGGSDTEHAIHATQAMNSVVMALCAIPVFFLGRRLGLGDRLALACAALTVLAPGMFYSTYLTAESVGLLLFLTATLVGVRALQTPTFLNETVFLLVAGAAVFARMQYLFLLPAFVVGAVAIERHPLRALRAIPLTSATLALGIVTAVATQGGLLGRYGAVTSFGLSETALRDVVSTGVLIAIAAGAALTPPAVAWASATIWRGGERAPVGFAAMSMTMMVLLVVASALMSVDTGSDRFFERYLIGAAPLAALGFGCWLKHGRPARFVVIGVAALFIVVAARVPASERLFGQDSADSPTLMAVSRLAGIVGIGSASLLAALAVTACAGLVIAASIWKRLPGVLVVTATAACFAAIAVGAHAAELRAADRVVATTWTHEPTWFEEASPGPTAFVQTPGSSYLASELMLMWSPSVTTASILPGEEYVARFDGIRPVPAAIRPDGALLVDSAPVSGAALFTTQGTTPIFGRDDSVVTDKYFALVKPRDSVHLDVLAEGVRNDGSLARLGRIAAYPTASGQCTTATVELTLPKGLPPTTLELRRQGRVEQLVVRAGSISQFSVTSSSSRGSFVTYRTLLLGARKPDAAVFAVAAAHVNRTTSRCSEKP